jgi:hypothetical protein
MSNLNTSIASVVVFNDSNEVDRAATLAAVAAFLDEHAATLVSERVGTAALDAAICTAALAILHESEGVMRLQCNLLNAKVLTAIAGAGFPMTSETMNRVGKCLNEYTSDATADGHPALPGALFHTQRGPGGGTASWERIEAAGGLLSVRAAKAKK